MKVLVACEFSGKVRNSFRELGHEAFSCDLIPSLDNSEYHIIGDVSELIDQSWDLMIAHPPCLNLSVSGAKHHKFRRFEQFKSINFFFKLMSCDIPKVCIENPVGVISSIIRYPDQIIQPYMFGDPHKKRTCLWLKGLPKLIPSNIVEGDLIKPTVHYEGPGIKDGLTRSQRRSKTYNGIAKAMASQWGMN